MAERVRKVEAQADQTKELRRQLGRWLKHRREAADITQAQLAERLGLRYYSFVSQVENGIGRIPQDLYAPWAKALGLDGKDFALTVLKHLEPGLYDLIAAQMPPGTQEPQV